MKTITFLLFILIAPALFGQNVNTINEGSKFNQLGISEEKLALIDDHINKFIREGHLPGGVFLAARRGEIIYSKTLGNSSPGKVYKEDDIFRLASMTKAITTVSIMQLVERGLIRLDDPVFYYIPEFSNAMIADNMNPLDSTYVLKPAKNRITIRHLLTHTSGITYGVFQGGAVQAMYEEYGANAFGLSHDSISTREMAQKIAKVPLLFEPGSAYSYGLNMDILGYVVEVVSGKTLGDYVAENITGPLEMKDTHFYLPKELHDRLVPVYTLDEEKSLIINKDPGWAYPKSNKKVNYAGGGGMSGTASDYLKFIQCLLDNGKYKGRQIISRNSIELIASDQMIKLNQSGKGYSKTPGLTYGLGFSLITEKGRGNSYKSPGTFEWGGMFNTKFFIDPEEKLVFVGMTQVLPFIRQDFWDKLYAILYSSLE